MTLDLRSAAVLLECARRGSLGRAATALSLTQPAVTRMLKRLEDSYGAPLFERTTRGVMPTIYGRALLPYAELMVSESANAADMIRQMRGASRGVVRVGGVASLVGGFILSAIRLMRRDHPDVQFHIVEELEDRLLTSLKQGDIDLAVSPEPYADDEIALATPDTFHDLASVFAAADHPVHRLPNPTLADVAPLDWAMPPDGTPVMREWLRRFHHQGIEPAAPCLISRSVPVIKSAAISQRMLCWLPQPLVSEEVGRGEMARVPVAELEWRRAFRVYRRKMGLMTPSAAILVDSIRKIGHSTGGEIA